MANVTNTNPMVIDTSGTIIAAGTPIEIRKLKVVGITTAGQGALVQDANSNSFWEDVAWQTNYSSNLDDFTTYNLSARTLNGLKVTITTGRLYIYKG